MRSRSASRANASCDIFFLRRSARSSRPKAAADDMRVKFRPLDGAAIVNPVAFIVLREYSEFLFEIDGYRSSNLLRHHQGLANTRGPRNRCSSLPHSTMTVSPNLANSA